MTDRLDTSSKVDELIEKRIQIAKNETKSDDRVVQIAWLARGIEIWHKTDGKRGHSPDEAERYIISSITRLIQEERREAVRQELELHAADWAEINEDGSINSAVVYDRLKALTKEDSKQ